MPRKLDTCLVAEDPRSIPIEWKGHMRCAVIANDDHRENLIYVHIIMRETDYSTNIPAIGHLLAFEINKVYLVCGLGERRWKIAHKQPSRGC